jgi:hypothetical protein
MNWFSSKPKPPPEPLTRKEWVGKILVGTLIEETKVIFYPVSTFYTETWHASKCKPISGRVMAVGEKTVQIDLDGSGEAGWFEVARYVGRNSVGSIQITEVF